MEMNLKLKLGIVILTLVSVSALAQGNGAGNGGAAIVCRDANGAIKGQPRLLDFYEAENDPRLGIPIMVSDSSYRDQLADRIRAVMGSLSARGSEENVIKTRIANFDLKYYEKNVLRTMVSDSNWIQNPNVKIWMPAQFDFHPRVDIADPSCHFELVAKYSADGAILWNGPVFKAMSKTDQSGIVMHEIVYWIYRDNLGAINSDEARVTVAAMYDSRSRFLTEMALNRLRSTAVLSRGDRYLIARNGLRNFDATPREEVGTTISLSFAVSETAEALFEIESLDSNQGSGISGSINSESNNFVSQLQGVNSLNIRKSYCHRVNQILALQISVNDFVYQQKILDFGTDSTARFFSVHDRQL